MSQFEHVSSSRRRFLITAALGLAGGPLLVRQLARQAHAGEGIFLTASDDPQGRHFVSSFDLKGQLRFRQQIDARGHGVATNPVQGGRAILFARRPGTLAYEIDVLAGDIRHRIQSAEHRHFFGHGCYSPDGQYLFTAENDYANGRGVIGIRETGRYTVRHEIPSYGIGPHDVRLLSDGKTLVVANGGILTHPDQPRKKLNVPTMQPSLAYIDSESGRLLGKYELDNHFLSIRHLSVGRDDTVGVALQYEGPREDLVPLVGFHSGEDRIRLASAPQRTVREMAQYTASICIDSLQRIAGVTCPRGRVVNFWDIDEAQWIKSMDIRDAGGIVQSLDQTVFVVTTGRGEIHEINASTLDFNKERSVRLDGTKWDNHLGMVAMAV